MGKEAERDGEAMMEAFKQNAFVSAFNSFNPDQALKRYYEIFEKEKDEEFDYDIEEFEPETEADVQEMMSAARRAGVIK